MIQKIGHLGLLGCNQIISMEFCYCLYCNCHFFVTIIFVNAQIMFRLHSIINLACLGGAWSLKFDTAQAVEEIVEIVFGKIKVKDLK